MDQFHLDSDNVRGARTIDDLIEDYVADRDEELLSSEVVFNSGSNHNLVLYPVMDQFEPVEEIEVLEYELNLANGDIVRVTIHNVYGITEGVHDGRYGPVIGKFRVVS